MNQILIVGCGGVASYLLPPLYRTISHTHRLKRAKLALLDGDTLEDRNLDRQQFSIEAVGKNKAEALAGRIDPDGDRTTVIPSYLYPGMPWPEEFRPNRRTCVIVLVDNHAARRNALALVDDERCSSCIIAANEAESAESYVYLPQWKGTPLDPRVRVPAILTDNSDDPVHPEGCTGNAALDAAPQTAHANFIAASFASLLFCAWQIKGVGLGPTFFEHLPAHIYAGPFFTETKTVAQLS